MYPQEQTIGITDITFFKKNLKKFVSFIYSVSQDVVFNRMLTLPMLLLLLWHNYYAAMTF